MLDLFQLHRLEDNRNAKQWTMARGTSLGFQLGKLVEKLRERLDSEKLANKLIIQSTIRKTRYTRRLYQKIIETSRNVEWVPLIFISTLLELYKSYFSLSVKEYHKIKFQIINSIENLVLNNGYSKPIRVVKKIDKNLAKIIGTFAADGNFATERMVRWLDEYKENLEILSRWFKSCFGIKLKIEHSKQDKNAFLVQLTNKLFCRYLRVFFDFSPGDKRYTIDEPLLIKQQPLKIRKAFASGALIFDGSVNFDGSVGFSSTSKKFRDSVAEILTKDGIHLCISSNPILRENRAPKWEFRTIELNNKSLLQKTIKYFEPLSNKWKILDLYLNESYLSLSDLYKLLPKNRVIRNVNFVELFEKLGKFDVYDLMKVINLSRKTINQYLHLFEVIGILSSKVEAKKRVYTLNNVSDNFLGSYSIRSS